MALSRRGSSRFSANIWPGFVDAMTALLLVLFFVLSIFMIVQYVLRDQVTEQGRELDTLTGQVNQLASALGLEQQRSSQLESQVTTLNRDLAEAETETGQQAALIARLTEQQDEAESRIASFEEQVASLIASNRDLEGDLAQTRASLTDTEAESEARASELAEARETLENRAAELESLQNENARQMSRNEALELALAQARDEIDESTQAARLAAARSDALEALVQDMRRQRAEQEDRLSAQEAELARQAETLDEAEAARLAEAAAAERLRERLRNSSAELTAMTLRLEEERRRAEETLTMLAAADAERDELTAELAAKAEALTEAERQQALLARAREALAEERETSAESQRKVALLNQQTAALNQQLRNLQGLLDEARAAEAAAEVRIETLGSDLNTALARVAAEQRRVAEEQRRRAEMEAAERKRLEAEAKQLSSYRSEFFGRVREILGDREGVRIEGDRFVFSSEVLFDRGSADLGLDGRAQLAQVAAVIREIRGEIPPGIDWILRVDGHTDDIPIGPGGRYADNWELSQARALSVVRYLIDQQGLPADRLSANAFGEYQPIDPRETPEARARNRRIELKFTER